MKVKLQPGTEFDVITPHELHRSLSAHHNAILEGIRQLSHGVHFHRFAGTAQADAAGNLTFFSEFGPANGFVWDVKRITISNSGGNIGGVGVFVNDVQPTSLVQPSTVLPEIFTYSSQQFIMQASDVLAFLGTALGANNTIYFSGQTKEVSLTEIGRLGL